MPTFDGEALTITLDSGVTSIDVINDIYELWKDWMLSSPVNRKYPQAFVSDGGNPLSAIINQGSYIFLQNQFGWRIRPPEEDITIYLTGNLAVNNTNLPAFIPTIGAYTAAILGLQPVTQGVTPSMGAQLEQVAFEGGISYKSTGEAGQGIAATGAPIGTRLAPSNNIADAHAIAITRGLNKFYLLNDLTIVDEDFHGHAHEFIGDSPFINLIINQAAQVSNSAITNLTVSGELDGINTVTRCSVGAVTNLSGFVEKCVFSSDITISGSTHLMECYSAKSGGGYINVTSGAHDLQVSDWHRSLGIKGMTGGVSTIEMYGGQLHLDSTCTGGTIYVRGSYSLPPNDQSDGTIVIDQSETKAIWADANRDTKYIEKAVWVDTEQVAAGDGSQGLPFNDLTAAIDYAETEGIKTLYVYADITLDRQLKNFKVIGVGAPTIDCNGQDLTKSEFSHCKMQGAYTSAIIVQESVLLNNFWLNGYFEKCSLAGDLFCINGSEVFMKNNASAIAGLGRPTISMNGAGSSKLSVRGNEGGLTIKDCNNALDEVTVEVAEGSLTFDASNTTTTANSMVARGMCKFVNLVPTAGVVVDETGNPANINIADKILRNKTETDPVTGVMTVYDDDGVTVLFTANIWENVAATTPYGGNAVNRRDKLA